MAYTILHYPGEVVVKMGTGGGNLGPDVYYPMSQPATDDPIAVDINGDGWLDIVVRITAIRRILLERQSIASPDQ